MRNTINLYPDTREGGGMGVRGEGSFGKKGAAFGKKWVRLGKKGGAITLRTLSSNAPAVCFPKLIQIKH